ncbi:MAG: DUF333 domain-containing protein [Candidatus Falkowbacteria bacterium]|nr:DUF333 domain-containing protein [Candidatus Falkowbacteria bacterium]
MKKILIITSILVFSVIVLIVALGAYKFNSISQEVNRPIVTKTSYLNTTYVLEGQKVVLKNGVNESTAAPDSVTKIVTKYFGGESLGDLNGDGQNDVALILTQQGGGSGTFYYLSAALTDNQGYSGLNAIFLGDRIALQNTEIKDGVVTVSYAERQTGEDFSVPPSVAVSKRFQVVDGQLKETLSAKPNSQLANPASTNCLGQGGTLTIQKRGDGGEYGLCNFEDNRSCEEWALVRGDCPFGGRRTTGFDTIDQKYCAWLGGETFAVTNSVCTFKDGSKCSTIDLYNGKCVSGQVSANSPTCPTGKKFFEENCSCPAPFNIRIGDVKIGFQCVGMPKDNLQN